LLRLNPFLFIQTPNFSWFSPHQFFFGQARLAPLGALDPSPNAVCFGAGLQACRTTGQSWDSNIRSGFFSQTLSEDFSDYGEAVVKLRDGSREMLVILMIEALL